MDEELGTCKGTVAVGVCDHDIVRGRIFGRGVLSAIRHFGGMIIHYIVTVRLLLFFQFFVDMIWQGLSQVRLVKKGASSKSECYKSSLYSTM